MNDLNNNEESDKGFDKRAVAIVAVPIVVIALFLSLFFFVFNNDSEDETVPEVKSEAEVSETEQIELEGLSEQIVGRTGNFGVKKDQVTADNVDELATLLETDIDSADYFFTPRAKSYDAARDFIIEGSPVDYSTTQVSNWTNGFETNFNVGFNVNSVEAVAYDKGSFVNLNGSQRRAVSVRVTFDSTETMFVEVGSEFGAERSYTITSKDFNNNNATFVFVADAKNNWKLYDIRDLNNQFLLSTWSKPEIGAYSETQYNFKEIDKLVPPNQNTEPTN